MSANRLTRPITSTKRNAMFARCVTDDAEAQERLLRPFVDLDRVAVWIIDLDLLATGPALHGVAKLRAGAAQASDQLVEIVDVEHDPVPAPGLLALAIGHR